jgi:hypothetical protein
VKRAAVSRIRDTDRIAEAAIGRLERIITSECLRLASQLAAVGISGDEIPQVIATCLRSVAEGLDPQT